MPTVTACGKTIACEGGANLRQVLLASGIALYNGNAALINCRGIGSCGTCAVEIEGETSPVNWRDRTRRSLPPHSPERNLRLACQTRVLGDLRVTKYDGFWGQGSQPVWTPVGEATT
ncbi:MAG TPA: (2Fe-2S)-binding protein [Oscillatoriales cyanobacterium M59_W2019_021]|nr:MAG: (2Fe-2S)-binding protein [Cyanobacteria bacterium J055]HIK31063.1 (2Fe-2S)-binding protein [Oscillatoriales cyanobacterium M4454_W2019_049]HIK51133.1 (2Fe-2S)-binding protein [Oscillatoriales cyanobacterium M59_W2019_021]